MLPSLKNLGPSRTPRSPLQLLKRRIPSDPDEPHRVTREDCYTLAAEAHRAVVAFYANPRLPAQLVEKGVKPLNALTREMRTVISQLNPLDFFLSPSTTSQDLPEMLARYQPKVLLLSGHTLGGHLLFENEKGSIAIDGLMSTEEFAGILDDAPSVQLVCLMACQSTQMVPELDRPTRARVSYISWSSVTEDDAALAFTRGIISELAQQLRGGELNSSQVFKAAIQSFLDGGFRFGDPFDASIPATTNPLALPHGVAVFSPAGQPKQTAT
tara:strand:+ start:8495 stop:9304 length:810 start_codon:yes stop_codon:yes gene_type:complete